MKRIYIVGLSLVAAIAFSAMATASASAAPEYGQCLKVKKGTYTNAGCTVTGKKGKYEWVGGPPPACRADKKGKYTNNTCATETKKGKFERELCYPNCGLIEAHGSTAYLESVGGAVKVECTTNGDEAGSGGILSATEAEGVAVYTGCKDQTAGAISCKSSNPAAGNAGEIKTVLLKATPELIGTEVWVNYTPKSGTYFTEFECGSGGSLLTFRVKGAAAGVYSTKNLMEVDSVQEFSSTLGNQTLELEEKTGGGSFGSPLKSFQNQTTDFSTIDGVKAELRE